jgi:hypothetical protein
VSTKYDYHQSFNNTFGNSNGRDHFGGLGAAFVGFYEQDTEFSGFTKGGEFPDHFQEVN